MSYTTDGSAVPVRKAIDECRSMRAGELLTQQKPQSATAIGRSGWRTISNLVPRQAPLHEDGRASRPLKSVNVTDLTEAYEYLRRFLSDEPERIRAEESVEVITDERPVEQVTAQDTSKPQRQSKPIPTPADDPPEPTDTFTIEGLTEKEHQELNDLVGYVMEKVFHTSSVKATILMATATLCPQRSKQDGKPRSSNKRSKRPVARRTGRSASRSTARQLVPRQPTDVLKPNGQPLLLFRPSVVPLAICERAWPALCKAGRRNGGGENRLYQSATIGISIRNDRRKTVFTANDLDGWGQCLEFIRACDDVFRRENPERYAAQRTAALHTDPRSAIGGTAFTTATVNLWDGTHDARTPIHRDKGDVAEGFGVISVLSSGDYSGQR